MIRKNYRCKWTRSWTDRSNVGMCIQYAFLPKIAHIRKVLWFNDSSIYFQWFSLLCTSYFTYFVFFVVWRAVSNAIKTDSCIALWLYVTYFSVWLIPVGVYHYDQIIFHWYRKLTGNCFYFTGPDGIRDHDTSVLDPNTYVGIGTMSPEGTSDLNYLWRPSRVHL